MKIRFLTLTFFVFVLSATAFSQDNDAMLAKNWQDLKDELVVRTNTILALSAQMEKSKMIDRKVLDETTSIGNQLIELCKTGNWERNTINATALKNIQMTQKFVPALVMLEQDDKRKNKKKILVLNDKLLESEKKLCLLSKTYNILCNAQKKPEMTYPDKCE